MSAKEKRGVEAADEAHHHHTGSWFDHDLPCGSELIVSETIHTKQGLQKSHLSQQVSWSWTELAGASCGSIAEVVFLLLSCPLLSPVSNLSPDPTCTL
jgi:hypothetical protein